MDILNQAWNHFDEINKISKYGPLTKKEECQQWLEIINTSKSNKTTVGFDEQLRGCHRYLGTDANDENSIAIPSLNIQMCCIIDYLYWGSQNVLVGPKMQRAFSDTELDKIPTTDLKFPFGAYWISLPENKEIKVYGGSPKKIISSYEHPKLESVKTYGTGWHNVKGAYVISRENGILVHMWAPDPEDTSIKNFLDTIPNGPKSLKIKGNIGLDWAHQWFSISFSPEKNLENAIEKIYSNEDCTVHDPNPDDPNTNYWESLWEESELKEEGQDITLESARKILRIIINSALYMTSPKSNIEYIRCQKRDKLLGEAEDLIREAAECKINKDAKKLNKKAKRKKEKAERYIKPMIWIGAEIEKRIYTGDLIERKSSPKGHIRKGHWHKFLTGPKRDKDGNEILPEGRSYIYHWIPPLWCGNLDNMNHGKNYLFANESKE